MTDAASALPVGSVDRRASGWYGVLCLIATESALFVYLLFSYYYSAVQLPPTWTPEPHPSFAYSLPATIAMLLSSAAVWWSTRSLHGRALGAHRLGLAFAIILGLIFFAFEGLEWASKPYMLSSNLYSSLFFTITGFDLAHLAIGIVGLCAVLIWSLLGYLDYRRESPTVIMAAYWHFVTAVWIAIFFTLYITPYFR
ncbi:MAG TPA: cytochrome c oxidase subunit 3 [Methylovirgula sp.]|nr:cytochrome c oxidase subunit 3 [Methylovirgula sp.]